MSSAPSTIRMLIAIDTAGFTVTRRRGGYVWFRNEDAARVQQVGDFCPVAGPFVSLRDAAADCVAHYRLSVRK